MACSCAVNAPTPPTPKKPGASVTVDYAELTVDSLACAVRALNLAVREAEGHSSYDYGAATYSTRPVAIDVDTLFGQITLTVEAEA